MVAVTYSSMQMEEYIKKLESENCYPKDGTMEGRLEHIEEHFPVTGTKNEKLRFIYANEYNVQHKFTETEQTVYNDVATKLMKKKQYPVDGTKVEQLAFMDKHFRIYGSTEEEESICNQWIEEHNENVNDDISQQEEFQSMLDNKEEFKDQMTQIFNMKEESYENWSEFLKTVGTETEPTNVEELMEAFALKLKEKMGEELLPLINSENRDNFIFYQLTGINSPIFILYDRTTRTLLKMWTNDYYDYINRVDRTTIPYRSETHEVRTFLDSTPISCYFHQDTPHLKLNSDDKWEMKTENSRYKDGSMKIKKIEKEFTLTSNNEITFRELLDYKENIN